MKPHPVPGLVIRYDYLWSDEARRGREEGAKDRPCAVVLAIQNKSPEQPPVAVICAITHTPPADPKDAIEIPPKVKEHLGLDDDRSWIVVDEVNFVDWADAGIIPVATGQWEYGTLPPSLAKKITEAVIERDKARTLEKVDRPKIEKRRAARDEDYDRGY